MGVVTWIRFGRMRNVDVIMWRRAYNMSDMGLVTWGRVLAGGIILVDLWQGGSLVGVSG